MSPRESGDELGLPSRPRHRTARWNPTLASALLVYELDFFLEHLPGKNNQSWHHPLTLFTFDR
jgi:hypothetical protein